ncbi:dTDP-4-dehydrorhamnose 3,5-epimerase family protein [Streptomyces sp. NBC_00328]|uniref:dTDP-4-dehydrorhamnose 3,5-epimerase family protein n=1 Tax=Streptomyces sp. NBC_00328 TaxID=2903646 RepID=UPI002E29B341|nr:dTDP-4-dehydrorhamnose 3,5-epimerase family protein [Streptomyces sp. NBC_00328]
MQVRELAVAGAFTFTPDVHTDERGLFVAPFQEPAFLQAVGERFSVAQINYSRSARGVIRGLHFTRTPPGQSKYVYCAAGRALDVMVDVRVGSPTFGKWDAVELDAESFGGVYFPLGVAHSFAVLEDDTVLAYMVSSSYVPDQELAIDPLDPELGLPWPQSDPILSPRDRAAASFAEITAQGLLPRYEDCVRQEEA